MYFLADDCRKDGKSLMQIIIFMYHNQLIIIKPIQIL